MYLYRVIDKKRYLNGNYDNISGKIGVNTFDYKDGEEYIHFFILPEAAEIYQGLRFVNINSDSVITRWDIPYVLLKDSFGVGIYRWYSPFCKHPFLEVRLNKNVLKREMVVDVSDVVLDEWRDEIIYNRYLNSVRVIDMEGECLEYPLFIDFKDNVRYQVERNPVINPKFNFLNYFPLEDLQKEGLKNDYENKNIAKR